MRGNGACTIPKFEVLEQQEQQSPGRSLFRVRASLALYADYLSADEFSRMTWQYLKEVDAIDNDLAAIIDDGSADRSSPGA